MRLHLLLSLLLLSLFSSYTALAQVVAPSQGGEVGLVLVTSTTIKLTFGNTGNGQGRVVAIAPAPGWNSVQLAAVDGNFYSANAEFGHGMALGKGYAVYSGPDHSVIVTGLQPSTVYYITNAEYNTDGTTILYNTRSSNVMLSTPAAPRPVATAPVPLPVTLTSFTGEVNPRGFATLHWTTATEQSTAYFSLERSADGIAFAEAGRVAASGDSNQPLVYSWPDSQPLAGPTYYRLRQTDRNGATRYSSVITLAPSVARSVDVYPSPSAGQLIHVLLQGFEHETLTLSLADALGRQVVSQTLTPTASRHQALLPTSLAAGTYFLTLSGQGSPVQKRIIVSE